MLWFALDVEVEVGAACTIHKKVSRYWNAKVSYTTPLLFASIVSIIHMTVVPPNFALLLPSDNASQWAVNSIRYFKKCCVLGLARWLLLISFTKLSIQQVGLQCCYTNGLHKFQHFSTVNYWAERNYDLSAVLMLCPTCICEGVWVMLHHGHKAIAWYLVMSL